MLDIRKHITAAVEAREYLTKADSGLGAMIEKYGVIDYELQSDYLSALLSTIVGQQLSGKVADVIWGRFVKMLNSDISAIEALKLDTETMRSVGLSYQKAGYIKNICGAVADGNLTLDKFGDMTDEAIIKQLTAIKGIGEWTAEMFLIFSLGRLDVFSNGDGGLARAINNLYGNGAEFTPKQRFALAETWKPYRSIASLYLWRSLDNR